MTWIFRYFAIAALTCVLAACATVPSASPQAQFIARAQALCGQSFSGRLVASDASDASFAGAALRMTVACADDGSVRIPFAVGEDRSRTWVLRRTEGGGIELKHDHRHEDGTPDVLTNYGGTAAAGTGDAGRQAFPTDDFSKALFLANDRAVSVDNVWAMEIATGDTFAYELRRPNRHFRVEFDLSRPVG